MPTLDALAPAAACADTDMLLVSQGGVARHASRAQLLADTQPALALLPGQVLGRFGAGPGGPQALTLGAGLAAANGILAVNAPLPGEAVAPEAFGAVGDGITDDSAAFIAAVATGKPVRLGPRSYAIAGQWTIATPGTVLLGTPGLSRLARIAQAGGAFVSVQADGFVAEGITFDARAAEVPAEAWNVLVTQACHNARFRDCGFVNAAGASLGCGLAIQGGGGVRDHVVRDCAFSANAAHGLWVQAASGVLVQGCRAQGNALWGINVDFNDPAFAVQARLVQVQGCRAWNNARGISVGNFNATNLSPPVWGNANPDAVAVLVGGNICHDNAVYGIAVSGQAIAVVGNLCTGNGTGALGGAGILANVGGSAVVQNMVTGTATYGIDCGGAADSEVCGNQVQGGSTYGINCGGSQNLRVAFNRIAGCTIDAVCAANTEADGQGNPFPLPVANLAIADNAIAVPAGAGGVWLRDGPQGVTLSRNAFTGPVGAADALRADTDGFLAEGNRLNGQARIVCNPVAGTLTVPDIADAILVTAADAPVAAMLGASAAEAGGAVRFVRILAGGSGYSTATLAIGGPGAGASARAVIVGGALIGALVSAPGAGYGPPGVPIPVAVSGDGSGAQAAAYAGAAPAEERRLLVRCNVPVRFACAGSAPPQESWTFADIDVPAKADIDWTATFGAWRAGRVQMADWLRTDGAGGAVLTARPGADLALLPAGGGRLRIGSDADPAGMVFAVGHGSPEGGVAAPPGSDYRNLDGGAGQTLWLKRSGTDAFGWTAIA